MVKSDHQFWKMKYGYVWIILLIQIILSSSVNSHPAGHRRHRENNSQHLNNNKPNIQNNQLGIVNNEHINNNDGEIISVRITSSVAVNRGKGKTSHRPRIGRKPKVDNDTNPLAITPSNVAASEKVVITDIPPDLTGANIEYIKQLNAKKEARGLHYVDQVHPFQVNVKNQHNNTGDTAKDESSKSILGVPLVPENNYNDDIPMGRSFPFIPKDLGNYNEGPQNILNDRRNNGRLTTVSFNIVHDTHKPTSYNEPKHTFIEPASNPQFYSEQPKVYSQPAKVYSEPAKFYGEPAKVYSEPAKVYSVPAKIYSEPAKIYSEPAKFYSQPASLHLDQHNTRKHWDSKSQIPISTAIVSTTTEAGNKTVAQNPDHVPEKNYEVDEKLSVLTDGRSHGVQESTTENCKVGYVVEGRQYRRYRVEERTPDGFIVGEYGVVRNEDGALRGVRYTADGEASPRLIYDALMKFLQLK